MRPRPNIEPADSEFPGEHLVAERVERPSGQFGKKDVASILP